MRKQWKQTVTDFIFLGSKITADGDCSHEIKSRLLLGRKAMNKLDSTLKSRDIISPTKVHLVKAMVFPIVMWELDYKESWVLKNWCFELWYSRRLLRVPWTARRPNQSILKEISPGYSLEGLMLKLKLQYFGHLMRRTDSSDPDAGKDWRREEKGSTEDDMIGWQHWLGGHEFKQALRVSDGQGGLVCWSPWVAKSWTGLSNWTEKL